MLGKLAKLRTVRNVWAGDCRGHDRFGLGEADLRTTMYLREFVQEWRNFDPSGLRLDDGVMLARQAESDFAHLAAHLDELMAADNRRKPFEAT